MKKSQKKRKEEVINLLQKQKIRSVEQIESYKLSICHPDAAGIDLGSSENYVALPPAVAAEMDLPIVHKFSTVTSGHEACRDLLLQCGIKDVCMESTGVYWINLHYILTQAGIHVCLVNPRMFRMVPGRKTDILDCQWLQTLHMYGLVRGSFIPGEQTRELRSYIRQRETLIQDRSRYVQRMQKALVEMNLMLVNVIDDITGLTGMSIITAILEGEHDPKVLAAYRDGRCKHSQEEIEESLKGIYKPDQLNLLQLNYDLYNFLNEKIAKLDKIICDLLLTFVPKETEDKQTPAGEGEKKEEKKKRKPRPSKNDIKTDIDLQGTLAKICGVDLTAITGFQANGILQVISEVGTDMSLFASAKNFVAYLGFAPHNKITGGVIISSKTDRKKSHAAQAFKKLIPSISRGKSALSAFYHRLAARIGTAKAIVATCRKLATNFYNSLKFGSEYVEYGEAKYKKQQQDRELRLLQKLASKHNMELKPAV